jgi:superfamily I DNA/RNA helicase
MGYYSNFILEVNHPDSEDIIADLRNNNEYSHTALDKYGDTNDQTKWYDMNKDMKEFSKKYPEVLFEMIREGESGGDDQCIYYFQNGKMQECWVQLKFPDYDPDKME